MCSQSKTDSLRSQGLIYLFVYSAVSIDQCKEVEGNNRMERLEISSRKLEIPRDYFMQGWACKAEKW